jgi:hypothetical protein
LLRCDPNDDTGGYHAFSMPLDIRFLRRLLAGAWVLLAARLTAQAVTVGELV